MNTTMLRRARELWNTGRSDLDRHNQRAWARSIRLLGDKWLLAKSYGRVQ